MKPALLISTLIITSCSFLLTAAGFPPEATRDSAPAGVIANALKAGDKAPNFALADVDGKKHSLVLEKGKAGTVLIFYRGYWCPYCRKQLVEINENLAKFSKEGYAVYAISTDDVEGMKSLKEKIKIDYPNISDPQALTAKAYKIYDPANETAWPATLIVDRNQQIYYQDVRNTYKTRALSADLLKAIAAHKKQARK